MCFTPAIRYYNACVSHLGMIWDVWDRNIYVSVVCAVSSPCYRKHVGACVHHDEEEDPS